MCVLSYMFGCNKIICVCIYTLIGLTAILILQLVYVTCVTSISENEMNIQFLPCNAQHLNRILNISLEIFLKKTH